MHEKWTQIPPNEESGIQSFVKVLNFIGLGSEFIKNKNIKGFFRVTLVFNVKGDN